MDEFTPDKPEQYRFYVQHGQPFDESLDRTIRDISAGAKLPQPVAHRLWTVWQESAAKDRPSPADIELDSARATFKLREKWGWDNFDSKLESAKSVFAGLPAEQSAALTSAFNECGIGNDVWLIRQLADLAEHRAGTTKD